MCFSSTSSQAPSFLPLPERTGPLVSCLTFIFSAHMKHLLMVCCSILLSYHFRPNFGRLLYITSSMCFSSTPSQAPSFLNYRYQKETGPLVSCLAFIFSAFTNGLLFDNLKLSFPTKIWVLAVYHFFNVFQFHVITSSVIFKLPLPKRTGPLVSCLKFYFFISYEAFTNGLLFHTLKLSFPIKIWVLAVYHFVNVFQFHVITSSVIFKLPLPERTGPLVSCLTFIFFQLK